MFVLVIVMIQLVPPCKSDNIFVIECNPHRIFLIHLQIEKGKIGFDTFLEIPYFSRENLDPR